MSEISDAAERRRFYNESEIRVSPILVMADAQTLADEYLVAMNSATELFKVLAPQCTPMDYLSGVISQIDNWCAGKIPPADDREAVTEEWLESIGLIPVHEGEKHWHVATVQISKVREWFPGAYVVVPVTATRGDVRRLLAALKIDPNPSRP